MNKTHPPSTRRTWKTRARRAAILLYALVSLVSPLWLVAGGVFSGTGALALSAVLFLIVPGVCFQIAETTEHARLRRRRAPSG